YYCLLNDNVNLAQSLVYFVPSRRYFSPAFGRSSPAKREEFVNSYNSATSDRSPQLSQFEGRLLEIERNQAKFNEIIRKVVPGMLEWSIDQHETGQYFLKFSSADKAHSSEGVGEGIISTFVIIASLFDSEPGDVIVIDEPELSLHPQIQKRMMSLFETYSADRQIVIATHSPYFITKQAIDGGLTIYRTWDRDGSIELHGVSGLLKESPLRKLASSNINNPHIFGLDAREVFFLEDGLLIFEGQEDVVLWPDIVRSVGGKESQIYGWGAGGAENIRNVLSLLKCLGFRRVAAVFDGDKAGEQEMVSKEFPDYKTFLLPADDIRTKKAVKSRDEKQGMLDASGKLRPDLIQAAKKIVDEIAIALEV
ncbi:MAG: ATP-binding protein, partial [Oxalobacteraceae bacterium]